MEVAVTLDSAQSDVVALPASARVFVVAGPGAGKTETLVHRVSHIAHGDPDEPPIPVLALTFTRAVVAELRRRFRENGVAREVRVLTIDAFARSITERSGSPAGSKFDEVVEMATRAITSGRWVPREQIAVVDEAQDLVGVRLEFIRALLASVEGFTVFGDPAQGIYGHQADGDEDPIAVLREAEPTALVVELVRNYRASSAQARVALSSGTALRAGADDVAAAQLREVLEGLPAVTFQEAVGILKRRGAETALLCRNNGEVLALSALLWDEDVPHRVHHGARVAVPPRWVAEDLGDCPDQSLSRARFDELSNAESNIERWKLLRSVASEAGDRIALDRVRLGIDRLATNSLAIDLESALPMLSTVHRAKGLGFHRVLILEPDAAQADQLNRDEARILFVALTRAQTHLRRLGRPKFPKLVKKKRSGRWVVEHWRKRGTIAFEIRVGDADRSSPPWGSAEEAGAARDQLMKATGGEVIELIDSGTGYEMSLGDVVVGRMSQDFEDALRASGIVNGANRPRLIRTRLESVGTAVGAPEVTEALGIGPAGLWLFPTVSGFGQLEWRNHA